MKNHSESRDRPYFFAITRDSNPSRVTFPFTIARSSDFSSSFSSSLLEILCNAHLTLPPLSLFLSSPLVSTFIVSRRRRRKFALPLLARSRGYERRPTEKSEIKSRMLLPGNSNVRFSPENLTSGVHFTFGKVRFRPPSSSDALFA